MKRAVVASLALSLSALLHAQEPADASVPGVARDCGVREAELKGRWAELGLAREALERETARLARVTEEMGIARGRAEMAGSRDVEAYNARLAEHNRDVAANNERVARLNAQSARFNADSAAVTAECNRSLRLAGGEEPRLDPDERAVLAAVLSERLGTMAGTVALENRTATFLCSRSLPDLVQFDGCSGMRGRSETPQDVVARLKRAWPAASDAALSDLIAKADQRARIEEPFAIAARQVLRGYGEGGGEATAMTVKVSRVGFDATRTEAIAFVAVRARGVPTAKYVRLKRAAGGEWRVSDRLRFP